MPTEPARPRVPMLRAASAADLGAVRDCIAAAFTPYIVRIGKLPGPMCLDHAAHIQAGQVWLAELEAQVLGVLVMYPNDHGYYIDTVAVSPLHQGSGAGRALLQFAERQALALGYDSIHLCTNQAMTENQVFYPKIGYVETGRGCSEGYQRIHYRKTLA